MSKQKEVRRAPRQNYSASQYESSFNPHHLQNWRKPNEEEGIRPGTVYKNVRPTGPDGKPDFVADDRGYLIKGRPRNIRQQSFPDTPETGTIQLILFLQQSEMEYLDYLLGTNDPLTTQINYLVQPIAEPLGLSLDIAKSIITFFATLVYAVLYPCLKAGGMRNLSSIFFGTLVLILNFGRSTIYFFGMCIMTYFLCQLGIYKRHPVLFFAIAMIIYEIPVLYVMKTAYGVWQVDITMALMILVQKLISFTYNLHDGYRNHQHSKQYLSEHPNASEKDIPSVFPSSHQRRMKLEKIPSFSRFMGYCLFPINILYGPACEYTLYNDSISRTKPLPKSRFYLAIPNLVFGLIFALTFIFPPSLAYLDDPEMFKLPFYRRIFICWFNTHRTRLKYYCAWSLTNAAMLFSGMGFDGKSWEFSCCVQVLRLESSIRPRDFIAMWNCGTQRFLKYYVYIRGPTSKKTAQVHPIMQFVTFILSAVWHGFYIAYYINFGILYLINVIDRLYQSLYTWDVPRIPLYGQAVVERENKGIAPTWRDFFPEPDGTYSFQRIKSFKDLVVTFLEFMVNQALFDFCASCFVPTRFDKVKKQLKFINYWGLFVVPGMIICLLIIKQIKKRTARKEKKQATKAQ
ncbi:putative Lysophospholipid acyltransferase [Blattamonas nauphoetae]|uniref:Lysophospholipid acyltransferase n=1 Tax=Blattamonas nauphoetae TaxID=2049346 RepID=A0ABQ9XP96_9EUKA|nr:putative Lysophospholipid acyltransferase [Blattamonas nauphoetae]